MTGNHRNARNGNKIMDGKTATILGIEVSSTQETKVLREIYSRLKNKQKFLITTPNPDIILKAQKDPQLFKALNSSDFSIPDGAGLLIAADFLKNRSGIWILSYLINPLILVKSCFKSLLNYKKLENNNFKIIKGRELFEKIVIQANKHGYKLFFVGGEGNVTQKSADIFRSNYKNLKLKCFTGMRLDSNGLPADADQKAVEVKLVTNIKNFKPDILFVGFGAPKQEKWAGRWIEKLDVGGIMVVGGTFDYVSGKTRLPPKWFPGKFEWLHRLIQNPKHLKRVINSTIIFPIKLLTSK